MRLYVLLVLFIFLLSLHCVVCCVIEGFLIEGDFMMFFVAGGVCLFCGAFATWYIT
jgi:hypothetical protein